jgi:hypothetical protein
MINSLPLEGGKKRFGTAFKDGDGPQRGVNFTLIPHFEEVS